MSAETMAAARAYYVVLGSGGKADWLYAYHIARCDRRYQSAPHLYHQDNAH